MANILGGIAVSHTPTIGFAVDHHKQQDPAWAPIFQSFEPLQRWLEEKKPDALVYIFNDHVTAFFFDHYSTFTLGIDSQYDVADEGGGPRCLPPVQGNAALSRHIGASLMADEFDMSFFMDKKLDHGLFSPLSALLPWDEAQGWPTAVIPLQIGVLQFPVPSARRCYKLGQALRRAIESFRKISMWRLSRPAGSRIRFMASAADLIIPTGMPSLLICWLMTRKSLPK
ncbi:Protocatechuate 4,5-dioxygenase beta chain [Serratia liquefaciens]|nr:Protocatechuate 4,5-dioxygenase beta chain [Serratia liquefaciens]